MEELKPIPAATGLRGRVVQLEEIDNTLSSTPTASLESLIN